MKLLNIFKKGFSLTELLIVLVIIAVLFAALAPIMTKRKQGDASTNEPVWSFVTNAKDAFYDPAAQKLTSAAYFGFSPSSIADLKPYAKVYLRAKTDQNHIQFRYGDNYGNQTGLFSIDNKDNIITSTRPTGNTAFTDRGDRITVFGKDSYRKWNSNSDITAIGTSTVNDSDGSNNTVVGVNAGQYLSNSNNIFIGANSGRGKGGISNTVGVGGRVLSIDESSGQNNVFVGYGVATAGFNSTDAIQNTVVASGTYGSTTHNSTIIGYGVYDANFGTSHDMTVVGYNACNSINMKSKYTNQGPKTCIGVNSADNKGNSIGTPENWADDKFEHIFIGGKPVGFNGRSVLEIHNMDSSQASYSSVIKPNIAPTVVLNSHLVVRGNLYFPKAKTGELVAHESAISGLNGSTEPARDRCGRPCMGIGRKKMRDRKKCYTWNKVFQALGNFLVGYTLGGIIIGSLATAMDWFFGDPSNWERGKDPISGSVMQFRSSSDYNCMSATTNAYPNKSACPNLNLSDIRLKENITENNDALDKIMFVMPYKYTYKNDADKKAQVGVIAQDLQEYLPDSVSSDANGYLKIKWDGIFYATINSLKKIDKDVSKLSADVDKIESDTTEVKNKHKSTQKRIDELNKRISKLENK